MDQQSYGIVFDMDGVLIDSKKAHFIAWGMLAEKLGVPCPEELFERTFGMHNNQIIPLWLGDGISLAEVTTHSRDKEALFREVVRENLLILEGALPLIQSVHQAGFRLAVGSSAPRANVDLVLETMGVTDRFSGLSTGDDVREGKPHPEVFVKAAGSIDLHPSRCVVLEDAPQGVEAARAAGSVAVAVTSTSPAEALAHADLVVDSLDELSPDRLTRLIDAHSK